MKRTIFCFLAIFMCYVCSGQRVSWVVPSLTCNCNVNEWISQDIGELIQYSTVTKNKSGQSAYLHVFYSKTVGFISEAWIYVPSFIVDHQDLPRFTVYIIVSYTLNGKRFHEETGARDWSCTTDVFDFSETYGNDSSGITVLDAALGGGNFLDMIQKTDVSVSIPSRTPYTPNRTYTFKRLPYQIKRTYN